MTIEQRRELARELASLADKAVAIANYEPGSANGDHLDGSTYDMWRAFASGNYGKTSKTALEILSSLGLTI